MKKYLTTMTLFFAATLIGCKYSGDRSQVSENTNSWNNSERLSEAGDRAKSYITSEFKRINDGAVASGSNIHYIVVDAQDPRLYSGAPFQPSSPADRVIVKVANNGDWLPTALIQNQPGYYAYKELNGQKVFWFGYNNERVEYRTSKDGLVASVNRTRTTSGFIFRNYAKGYGNNVTDIELDQIIASYLDGIVRYAVSR